MTTKQPNPLSRRDRESERAHRAFLLWAMQDPERRSGRASSRAVSRSEPTVREWRRRWEWVERIDGLELAEMKAQALYRQAYYPEHKLREVIEVEDRMAAPFLPDTPLPASVAEAVGDAIKPDTRKDQERKRDRMERKRHVSLIDASLGYIAQQLQAGKIRASLRDVPLLLRMREEMTQELQPGGKGHGPIVESVRVRCARESGSDVVSAMHEDAQELCAILGALRTAKTMEAERDSLASMSQDAASTA